MMTTTTATTRETDEQASPPSTRNKSIENTVFVRFVPPNDTIRRHTILELFSQLGPVKKSSIIHTHDKNNENLVTSSFGFIKYTTHQDAALAALRLNRTQLTLPNNNTTAATSQSQTTLHVELAQNEVHNHNKHSKHSHKQRSQRQQQPVVDKKKSNRLILRNLSFLATEKDVRKALAPFGTLTEVHLPTVGPQHTRRGFGFVTLDESEAVQALLSQSSKIAIKNRPVQMARALHKTAYESTRHRLDSSNHNDNNSTNDSNKKDAVTTTTTLADGTTKKKGHSDGDSTSTNDTNDDEKSVSSTSNGNSDNEEEDDDNDDRNTNAVAEKRSLFLRNLPFDVSRHDIFEAFRKYGHIDSIFIVKDKETGKIPRGTAFVSFSTPQATSKALTDCKGDDSMIVLKGRTVYADLAVDKETATTLSEKKTVIAKDRRHLYLKTEGRVDNTETSRAWDELPPNDQTKRQSAWSDKNTKLRSPVFFINPHRLSVRNLAKHVEEVPFKQLMVRAVQAGLQKRLVSLEDQIAHWKAVGEWNSKEILEAAQNYTIPPLDSKNIRECIPAIHIHRDYEVGGTKSNTKAAPSRGFGFVEFKHHLHALACLRELNNNTKYSAEYAAGGKFAANKPGAGPSKRKRLVDVKIPRLIVEFTVENKAKAKQQEQHRAQQKANRQKQQNDNNNNDKKKEPKKRKSRGAAQREKKRQLREQGVETASAMTMGNETTSSETMAPTRPQQQQQMPTKAVRHQKPPKKKPAKTDAAEETFAKLVETYKQQAASLIHDTIPTTHVNDDNNNNKNKRWFED